MLKTFSNLILLVYLLMMASCATNPNHYKDNKTSEKIFFDNKDGTFTDKKNHLQWAKFDSLSEPGYCYGGGEKDYYGMRLYLGCLNKNKYLGYNDWRMPTYKELEILRTTPEREIGRFLNQQSREMLDNHSYWSTTDMAILIKKRGIMIYNVVGPIYSYHMASGYYVWPVRTLDKMKLIASSR